MTKAEMHSPPWQDPIVAEVRAAREALFAEVGNDLDALCRLLEERQREGGRRVVTLPRRTPQPEH